MYIYVYTICSTVKDFKRELIFKKFTIVQCLSMNNIITLYYERLGIVSRSNEFYDNIDLSL